MTSPRTTREALIAEMLGDLDGVLDRVESLPMLVAEAERKLTATAAALDDAGDKYRMAVTAFNEQAKAELNEYLNLKSLHVAAAAAKTTEEQRAAIQEATREVLQSKGFHPSKLHQVLEHLLVATTASTLTAVLMVWILQHH